MALLTDKDPVVALSLSDLIHIVDVDDTTSNPLGTSKKASIQQVRDLVTASVDQFTELNDTPANYSGASLQAVRVNAGETALEFYTPVFGSTTYTGLTDTPSAFTSDNNKFLRVNAGATAVEHVAASVIGLSSFNNDAGFVTSNLTHTGEVTGAASLTIDKTAITNKTTVTAAAGDFLLITDATDTDNLKKVNASDFLAGGADGNGIYDGSGALSGSTTITAASNNLIVSTTGDANTLFVDATNGRLGVGTAIPTEKLEVVGNAQLTGNITQTATSSITSLAGGEFRFERISNIPTIWLDQTTYTLNTASFWQSGNTQVYNVPTGGKHEFRFNAAGAHMALEVPSTVNDSYFQISKSGVITNKLIEYTEGNNNGIGLQSGKVVHTVDSTVDFVVAEYDGTTTTDLLTVDGATGDLDVKTGVYKAGGVSGVASFTGAVSSITITNGIVTAIS